jgi:transcriptional regulator with XRE-family HTH domain
MLRTNGSTSAPEETGGPAAATRVEARPLSIDPSLRAGDKLTAAREQRGLSLEQLSDKLRIRRDFLEALEAMNAKLLPGKAYTLAYLKSYAREVGLDPAEIVDQYQRECALSREDVLPQVRSPRSRPAAERPWLLLLGLGAIAGGFVAWQTLRPAPATAPAAPVIEASADPAPPLTEAAPDYAPRRYEVRALAEARLEVRGADGTTQLYRVMRPGEVYRPDPSPGWTLHTADGGAFEVAVDGLSAGPLGEPGKPVIGRRLDSIEPPVLAEQTSQSPAR